MNHVLGWWLRSAGVAALAVTLAVMTNVLAGPYFERSFLEEASPLVTVATPSPTTREPVAEATPTSPLPMDSAAAMAGILLSGELRDGEPGHNGEGLAQVIRDERGTLYLRLEQFSVTNGPDLFVVLSPDANGYADGSLNLGGLKATDGSINYEIPIGTDLAQFKSAVIWCRAFDVTFAVAALTEAT